MRDELQKGVDTLAQAGNNKQFIGMSLILIHGALETYFRNQLAHEIDMALDEGERADWPKLIELWEESRGLSPNDKTYLFSKNKLRNLIAHNKPYQISRSEVESYAEFVQDFTGVYLTTSGAAKTASQPSQSYATPSSSYSPPIENSSFTPKPRRSCLRRFGCLGLIILCFGSWWLVSSSTNFPDVTMQSILELLEEPSDVSNSSTRTILNTTEPASDENTPNIISTRVLQRNSEQGDGEYLQVIGGDTNVRLGPGLEFGVIEIVPIDAVFLILETNEEATWYQIELESGKEGWIGSSRIELLSE